MKRIRLLPFLFIGANLLGVLAMMAVRGPTAGTAAFAMFNVLLAGIAGSMTWLTSRRAERALLRSAAAMQVIAKKAFDAPVEVQEGFESSLTGAAAVIGPGGALSPAPGFTAAGTVGGVATKIATCTSTFARQRFELHHSYSYVTVDAENAAGRFRFLGRDDYLSWTKMFSDIPDHPLGHADFDAQWVVAGDADIARGVLDDALRAELTELQRRAHAKTKGIGMSIELTAAGLVVRWPGEIDEVLAVTLRDLALRLRGRLLGHLRQEGLIEAAAPEGVRVEVDAAEVARELEAVVEVAAAAPGKRA